MPTDRTPRPSPYALWKQANGDQAEYERLLIEHGHLVPNLHRSLPDRVVVGRNGAYWRDFGSHYSMAVVSTDNDPVEPIAVYVREAAARSEGAASRDAEVRALREAIATWHTEEVNDEGQPWCMTCGDYWPCPTMRALAAGPAPVPAAGLDVERLAKAMEFARSAIVKSDSTGLRYREIHDDSICARDEHGCGCLCHAAKRIAVEYARLAAAQPAPEPVG